MLQPISGGVVIYLPGKDLRNWQVFVGEIA
jgi:hypothetical protein